MADARLRIRAALRRLYNAAVLVFGVLLALPLRLIRPAYRVEIQKVWAERIGHLALEPEMLLCDRAESQPARTSTWFFTTGPVANDFLLRMWHRTIPFGPSWALNPIDIAGRRFAWLDLRAPEWDETHFDITALDRCPPHLDFTPEEMARGQALLRDLGVPEGKPYVCLAVRDSAYLKVTSPERDWSYHNYRDSQIEDYVAMVTWLTGQGFAVLRMGSVVDRALETDDALVIDYATSRFRSDFGDVFLFAHCDFCISTSTGVDSLAMAFRRPMGVVNVAGHTGVQAGRILKLMMFKDYVDVRDGTPISLDDPRQGTAMTTYRTEDFAGLGLAVRDNSPAELREFAQEFLELLAGTWEATPEHMRRESAYLYTVANGRDISHATVHIPRCWLDHR